MNIIDKIYELIKKDSTINTFNNNLELFQEFYYRHMSIEYNGIKVIEIYKYLLSLNISEDHETMPYINSKIFKDFNNYEMSITQKVYMNDRVVDDNYIKLLFDVINIYNEFKVYEEQGKLNKIIDINSFVRDYTGSMIIILNSSFFNISNENILTMMSLIKNNRYLQKIIEDGKIGKELLDVDYIFQYVSRFLFNAEFVNEENINNDILINAIKESKFKDKKTLKKIFTQIDIYFLLTTFNNDLTLLVDVLEQSVKDKLDRIELFKIIYSKLIEEKEYRTIIKFIMNDNRNIRYITEEEQSNVIRAFSYDYSIDITNEEIEFILEREKSNLFLINLKSDINNNEWNDEIKNKVQKITENIPEYNYDFDSSIDVLDSLFKKNNVVNELMVISALKGLIKSYLKIEDIKIYIILDDKINGCAYTGEENYIKLNYNLIKKLIYTSNYENNPESIHILETIFHEARHIQQSLIMKDENMSEEMYYQYKENIISYISSGYYSKNYIGVSFEKDARIVGSEMVVYLLKQYFPYMKNVIKHYEEKIILENSKDVKNKKVFELSKSLVIDEIIEKLVTINPSIIEKFDILKREYNLDGSKTENKEINTQMKK